MVADVAVFADVVDVTVVAVGVAVEDHGSERDNYNAEAAIVTDDCKGFVVVTATALVVDAALVNEAAVVVPHCEELVFIFLVLRVYQSVLFFILSGFSFTTIHELQGCSEKGRAFL